MMNIEFTTGKLRYTRVSKTYARKHYKSEVIHICPVKLIPGPPWSPDLRMWDTCDFDRTVEQFAYYNCGSNEEGYYPAFYKVTSVS